MPPSSGFYDFSDAHSTKKNENILSTWIIYVYNVWVSGSNYRTKFGARIPGSAITGAFQNWEMRTKIANKYLSQFSYALVFHGYSNTRWQLTHIKLELKLIFAWAKLSTVKFCWAEPIKTGKPPLMCIYFIVSFVSAPIREIESLWISISEAFVYIQSPYTNDRNWTICETY